MNEQNNIRKELEELDAPLLQSLQGAKQPALSSDKLEALTQRAMHQAQEEPIRPSEAKTVQFRLVWRWAVAATVLLAAGWLAWPDRITDTTGIAGLDELPTDVIEQYIVENVEDFELAMWEEVLPEETILDPTIEAEWSEEALENYLQQEEQWPDDEDSLF